MEDDALREKMLDVFKNMYAQAIGSGPVMDYLTQTGLDALRGADIINSVVPKYSSTVEYAPNSFAKAMKSAAQVLQADIGTRVCYTQHGSFDAHTNGINLQAGLLTDVSGGIYDFYTDMKEHNQSDDVLILVFSEFGRRVNDNGDGTDHGSGGVAFVIGDGVRGGHHSYYPSPAGERPGRRRPGLQSRLPQRVHRAAGGLAGGGSQAHREGRVRKGGLPEELGSRDFRLKASACCAAAFRSPAPTIRTSLRNGPSSGRARGALH